MSRWTAPDRFALALFGAFAGLGVLLASVGIYGVVAQLVTARRREIGIRLALGAERRDVLQLVFGEALRFITAGIGIGLLLAFALVRFISSLLYDVSAYDPLTFAAVVAALVAAAAAASAIPAGRAARLDPMTALREE
jgi:putative ABC transport system permease protein